MARRRTMESSTGTRRTPGLVAGRVRPDREIEPLQAPARRRPGARSFAGRARAASRLSHGTGRGTPRGSYFDPNDALDYPLEPLNLENTTRVSRDLPLNVSALYSNWDPASPAGYWTDDDFTKPATRRL